MANDKKPRPKTRVAVKSKPGDGIPTVTVPVAGRSAPKPKTRPKGKTRKAKKTKPIKLDSPPVGLTPPAMPDTRPVRPATPAKPRIVDVETPETGLDEVPASVREEIRQDIPDTRPAPVNGKPKPRTGPADANDRMVQGAQCTWIGYLSEAPDGPDNRPVCPHCSGNLITAADEATIQLGFEAFEFGAYTSVNPPPRPHPGYRGMMAWMRTQSTCWTTIEAAAANYKAATGNDVDPRR